MAKYGKSKDEPAIYCSNKRYSIDEWKNWSLTPHSPDEIRDKILDDFENVCFSFVCTASKIPEEFMSEFMALSTGLITRENYDDYIDKVTKAVLMNAGVIEKDKSIMNWGILSKSENCKGENVDKILYGSSMTDRVDWYAITVHQKLSEDFMRKYQHVIKWNMVPHHQRITTAFYAEMHDRLPVKAMVRATKTERDDRTEHDIAEYFKNIQLSS